MNDFLQQPAYWANRLLSQISQEHVSPERQRQTGSLLPPDTQVHNQVQALILKRQLSFVDDQSGVISALGDGGQDAIERNDEQAVIAIGTEAIRQQQAQSQIGGGQSTW